MESYTQWCNEEWAWRGAGEVAVAGKRYSWHAWNTLTRLPTKAPSSWGGGSSYEPGAGKARDIVLGPPLNKFEHADPWLKFLLSALVRAKISSPFIAPLLCGTVNVINMQARTDSNCSLALVIITHLNWHKGWCQTRTRSRHCKEKFISY